MFFFPNVLGWFLPNSKFLTFHVKLNSNWHRLFKNVKYWKFEMPVACNREIFNQDGNLIDLVEFVTCKSWVVPFMVTLFSFLSLTCFIFTIPSITHFLNYHSLNAHCHIFLSLNHPMFGQIQWRCNMSIPFLPFLIYNEASRVMMRKKFKIF